MLVDDFKRRFDFMQRMTVDFVDAVPDDVLAFFTAAAHRRAAPCPPAATATDLRRSANSCGTWCAFEACMASPLVTQRADFSKKHSHYSGGLGREELWVRWS